MPVYGTITTYKVFFPVSDGDSGIDCIEITAEGIDPSVGKVYFVERLGAELDTGVSGDRLHDVSENTTYYTGVSKEFIDLSKAHRIEIKERTVKKEEFGTYKSFEELESDSNES